METLRKKINIKSELIKKIVDYEHPTENMSAWKYDLKILVEAYLKNM